MGPVHSPRATALLTVVALGLGAAMALMFSSEAGARGDASRVETFRGVCDMSGVIRHEPALTNEPAPTQVRGVFRGACSGELTNHRGRTRQLDGVWSAYKARPAGELSCVGGTAIGNGRLIIGR